MTRWSLLLLLSALAWATAGPQCNAADYAIYAKQGSEFATLFRSYAAWYVSQSAYEARIVAEMHLSPSCAACYGAAYTCGWENCKLSCAMEGPRCDTCLLEHACIQKCNSCTGF